MKHFMITIEDARESVKFRLVIFNSDTKDKFTQVAFRYCECRTCKETGNHWASMHQDDPNYMPMMGFAIVGLSTGEIKPQVIPPDFDDMIREKLAKELNHAEYLVVENFLNEAQEERLAKAPGGE